MTTESFSQIKIILFLLDRNKLWSCY